MMNNWCPLDLAVWGSFVCPVFLRNGVALVTQEVTVWAKYGTATAVRHM
jgi:hypothetical protein